MGDVVQLEANETAKSAGTQTQTGVADRVYKVVAPSGGTSHEDLYGFRAAFIEPPPVEQKEADQKAEKSKRAAALLPILLILVLAGLAFLIIPKLMKSNAPPQYPRFGNPQIRFSRFGARLIARWEGSTAYELYIDPLDPQQAAGFQAVVVNPPRPVSVVIRLLDSTGAVACQKEVVLPTTRADYRLVQYFPGTAAIADGRRRHDPEYCRSGRANCGDYRYRGPAVFA